MTALTSNFQSLDSYYHFSTFIHYFIVNMYMIAFFVFPFLLKEVISIVICWFNLLTVILDHNFLVRLLGNISLYLFSLKVYWSKINNVPFFFGGYLRNSLPDLRNFPFPLRFLKIISKNWRGKYLLMYVSIRLYSL